jgi:hypothetical protein
MSKLVMIVEGPTERAFVQQHLGAHLARYGIHAWPVLPGRRGTQGGVRHWTAALDDILRVLRDGNDCTTMFDFYGLPDDWPGRPHAAAMPYHLKARHVERSIMAEVEAAMRGVEGAGRFVPYIQLHEFEALLFADVAVLASVASTITEGTAEAFERHFAGIVQAAGGNPEAINDHYTTCPSRRILAVVPRYRKVQHGAIIAGRIGLGEIRRRCRHFADWVARLESLADDEPEWRPVGARVPDELTRAGATESAPRPRM